LEVPSVDSYLNKIRRVVPDAPEKFVLVDIARQRLSLLDAGAPLLSYIVSTSSFGIGNREGSQCTPPGVHRIIEKIGDGAPSGTIFRDRIDTGVVWRPGITGDNMILTRILRLEGLQDGINRGPGIDTFERYIYIHGTNQEQLIGTPLSHGCVCMKNRDIIELFDNVMEGTIVIID